MLPSGEPAFSDPRTYKRLFARPPSDFCCPCQVSAISAAASKAHGARSGAGEFLQDISNSLTPSDAQTSRGLDCHQPLLEVGDDVFFVLDADRYANDVGTGTGLNFLRV